MKTSVRILLTGITLGSLTALPALAQGQPNRQNRPDRPERPNRPDREEILRRFDADGNGVLCEAERANARKTMQEERMKQREIRRQERIDAGLPVGPGREEILARFDADGDGVLNETERATARETLRRERQARQTERRDDAKANRPERPDRPDRPDRPERPNRPDR